MNYKEFISNLFFPKNIKCIICNNDLNENTDYCVCDKCYKTLAWNNGHFCKRCGNPLKSLADYCLICKKLLPPFEQAVAPFVYKDKLVAIIEDFKYNNKSYLAPYLSNIIYDTFQKTEWQIDLVYPVPLFKTKEKQRGYNQSLLLCKRFEQNHYVVKKDNLIRIKNTETQTNLNYNERQENLNGAFKIVNKKEVKGKNVLLVDDVFTTGSTLKHCANALLKAGANKVYCLTLAHVENFKIAEGD